MSYASAASSSVAEKSSLVSANEQLQASQSFQRAATATEGKSLHDTIV
jgi:hypothetical protein